MQEAETWVEYWCDLTRNFLLHFYGTLPNRQMDIRTAPSNNGYIFSIGEENSLVTTRIELENILRSIDALIANARATNSTFFYRVVINLAPHPQFWFDSINLYDGFIRCTRVPGSPPSPFYLYGFN